MRRRGDKPARLEAESVSPRYVAVEGRRRAKGAVDGGWIEPDGETQRPQPWLPAAFE